MKARIDKLEEELKTIKNSEQQYRHLFEKSPIMIYATDLHGRLEAAAKLKESEGKYRAILDNSLAGIYMFQKGGHFSFVNKRLIRMLRYDNEKEPLKLNPS